VGHEKERGMIRFFLLQNRHGKTRLAKYYTPVADDEKRRLEHEVSRLVLHRDPKFTNFVEVRMEKRPTGVLRWRERGKTEGKVTGWLTRTVVTSTR